MTHKLTFTGIRTAAIEVNVHMKNCFLNNLYFKEGGDKPARSKSAMKKIVKKRKSEESQARSASRGHSSMRTPRDQGGIKDAASMEKVKKIAKLGQRKRNQFGRAGRCYCLLVLSENCIILIC